jgi:hypothetical protein
MSEAAESVEKCAEYCTLSDDCTITDFRRLTHVSCLKAMGQSTNLFAASQIITLIKKEQF